MFRQPQNKQKMHLTPQVVLQADNIRIISAAQGFEFAKNEQRLETNLTILLPYKTYNNKKNQ
jgi:hypothetical protein